MSSECVCDGVCVCWKRERWLKQSETNSRCHRDGRVENEAWKLVTSVNCVKIVTYAWCKEKGGQLFGLGHHVPTRGAMPNKTCGPSASNNNEKEGVERWPKEWEGKSMMSQTILVLTIQVCAKINLPVWNHRETFVSGIFSRTRTSILRRPLQNKGSLR